MGKPTLGAVRKAIKILVVEDNATDLKLIHSVLEGAGHEVSDAVTAEEAVEILRQNRPQVIVTDLDLPVMDGVAMARQLKRTPETASIPVIAVTAYPDNFPRRAMRDAGFAAYFVKPINTRTLSQQVADVLLH